MLGYYTNRILVLQVYLHPTSYKSNTNQVDPNNWMHVNKIGRYIIENVCLYIYIVNLTLLNVHQIQIVFNFGVYDIKWITDYIMVNNNQFLFKLI